MHIYVCIYDIYMYEHLVEAVMETIEQKNVRPGKGAESAFEYMSLYTHTITYRTDTQYIHVFTLRKYTFTHTHTHTIHACACTSVKV